MEADVAAKAPASPARQQQIMAKACDVCRRKKIRCDPTREGCAQCTKYRTHCHFSPIPMRKKTRKPAGFKYIASLEERLKKMEGLLDRAISHEGRKESDSSSEEYSKFGVLDLEAPNSTSNYRELKRPWVECPMRDTEYLEELIATPKSLTSNGREDSMISSMKTPVHENLTSVSYSSPLYKEKMALGPFSLPAFHQLPAKPVAQELIKDAFSSFNRFFPLFDERRFLEDFQEQYLISSPGNPSWWACINVVLALAHRFRAMRTLETTYDNGEACGYMHNGLAVVSELNMLHDSLPAVQGLVGMALVLQGTQNPQAASTLLAMALRLAQGMGLHRSTPRPDLTEEQTEQRRRVFWIAYFLDKDISLRTCQPFAQDDDDMDAELPRENSIGLSLSNEETSFVFFKSRIGLAVIQGQVYKRLYSVQATRQSRPQKVAAAQELDSLLSYWKDSTPIISESLWERLVQPSLTVKMIHMLILYFTYVNCRIMIHRQLVLTERTISDGVSEFQSVFMYSDSIGIIEARKSVRLVQKVPPGDYACIWILLHPFFTAVTFLLDNVLQYSESSQARGDLQITEPFLRLLEILVKLEGVCARSEEARKMHQTCNDLHQQASQAVERVGFMVTFE